MTVTKFQRLLKKIDPRLTIRVKGYGDVAGVFFGVTGKRGYICRVSKGELHLNGFRYLFPSKDNPLEKIQGPIQKRGRKTVINLLRNYRWVTNHRQKSMLTWGIEYPDAEVRGITNGHTSG